MVRGLYQNSSSMQLLQDRMDVIANNMANVSTNGYKRQGVFYRQLIGAEQALDRNQITLKQLREHPFTWQNSDCCTRRGQVRQLQGDISTYTDYADGPVKETGNPLDIAINGKGFFVVQTPEGTGYTRDGQFKIDQDGNLVTSEGYLVQGEAGPIQITGDMVNINAKGELGQDGVIVNKLMIRDFPEDTLMNISRGVMYPQGENVSAQEADVNVLQGYLESSNVVVVKEMVDMISTQRHFQANEKVINAMDTTLRKTANDIGK